MCVASIYTRLFHSYPCISVVYSKRHVQLWSPSAIDLLLIHTSFRALGLGFGWGLGKRPKLKRCSFFGYNESSKVCNILLKNSDMPFDENCWKLSFFVMKLNITVMENMFACFITVVYLHQFLCCRLWTRKEMTSSRRCDAYLWPRGVSNLDISLPVILCDHYNT